MKIITPLLLVLSLLALVFVLINYDNEEQDPGALEVEVMSPAEESPLIVRALFFGDLMLDRGVESTIARGVNPFEFVTDFIRGGEFDLVVANLEGPFAEEMECQNKPYSFRFEPEYVSFLQSAGINAVSLSNNHTLDCFSFGLSETRRILSEASIDFFGGFTGEGGDVLYRDFEGNKVALLGFDDTMKIQSVETMRSAVEEASLRAEKVIVNIHWGEEYFREPTTRQREIASTLTLAGADIIIGHHPHVVEPAEALQGALVFYSLGNFVFDQLTRETQTGYAVEIDLNLDTSNTEIEIHPYLIIGNQPTFLEGSERLSVCGEVLASFDIEGGCRITYQP